MVEDSQDTDPIFTNENFQFRVSEGIGVVSINQRCSSSGVFFRSFLVAVTSIEYFCNPYALTLYLYLLLQSSWAKTLLFFSFPQLISFMTVNCHMNCKANFQLICSIMFVMKS